MIIVPPWLGNWNYFVLFSFPSFKIFVIPHVYTTESCFLWNTTLHLKEEENTTDHNPATIVHILQKYNLNKNICTEFVHWDPVSHDSAPMAG